VFHQGRWYKIGETYVDQMRAQVAELLRQRYLWPQLTWTPIGEPDAAASHLYTQVLVSTEALRDEPEAMSQLAKKTAEQQPGRIIGEPPATVVLAAALHAVLPSYRNHGMVTVITSWYRWQPRPWVVRLQFR
jgi:hypothetical protein